MDIAKTREIVGELLEVEEATNSANLTRRERAEMQAIVKEAFEALEEKRQSKTAPAEVVELTTETKEGTLVARVVPDFDYPGITIDLRPKDTENIEIPVALTEHLAGTGIRTAVWGDAMQEDYTMQERLVNVKEHIDAIYEEEMGRE